MMIAITSDTHGQQPRIGEADMFIHAGDTCLGTGSEKEFLTFIDWMGSRKPKYKVLTAGNHDKWVYKQPSGYIRHLCAERGIVYLDHSTEVVGGLKIFGSPLSPEIGSWAFPLKRGDTKVWECIPEVDIVVTHGPPQHILDRLLRWSATEDPHNGCPALRDKIFEIKPKLHIFGHIHEGYGHLRIDDIDFINASYMDAHYRNTNKVIYYNGDTREIR